MFSTEHFIWMGICAAVITLLTFFSLKFKFSFKTASLIMAGVALASETSKILSHMEYVDADNISDGMAIEPTALPFHLCSILIFAFFYLPFCKNEKIKNYLVSLTVPVGLTGSILAIIMATSGTNFAGPEAYQCFIYHAVLTWFALYLMITKQADLGIKAWIINLVSLFSYAIIMIWVNGALREYDTNFLFVVRPPKEGLPILNLNHGWYAYFGILMLCGFIMITAVHLPFIIKELKKKKVK